MTPLLSNILLQLRIGLRDPAFMFTSILLPACLYWFFAVPESGNAYIANFLVASFSSFAFFGVMFLQHAVHTSQERQSPWALYLKALPISNFSLFISRFVTAVFLGTLSCVFIYSVALFFTPSDMTLLLFLKILLRLILGSIPFLLFGILVGQIFNPKSVVPVANFIHLLFSFVGGLWKPPEILPEMLQPISPWLPTYHYGMLSWSLITTDIQLKAFNLIYLAVFSFVLLALLMLNKRFLTVKN